MKAMNKVNKYDDEYELDLLLLLSYLLKKWKTILILGIVCAVVAIGYNIITVPSPEPALTEQENKPSAAEEAYKQRIQAYDDYISENKSMLTRYQEQLDRVLSNRSYLEGLLAEIENEQKARDDFRKNSKLLSIDPYNVYKGIRTYSVSIDYQTASDMSYQNIDLMKDIISAYVVYGNMANVNDNEVLNDLSLCSVSTNDNNLIIISAMGSDENQVNQYINNAGMAIENAQNTVYNEIGEHNLTLLETGIYKTFDSNLEALQNEYKQPITAKSDISDRINSSNSQINNLYINMLGIRKTIKETEDAKSNVGKPEIESNDVEPKRMSISKAATIGFIIGIIVCVVFFIFRYVTIGTIKSANELERRYGINVLGSIKDDLGTSIAVETINSIVSDNNPLIIMGSVGREVCQRFADTIREKYPSISTSVAGDIASDIDGIVALKDASKVIIIEKINESKVNNISHEIEIILSLGSEIVGFITV